MTACGDNNSGSEESFCDDFEILQENLAELADPTSAQLDDVVARLDDIDPPEAIESAYNELIDTYRDVTSGDASLTDPAMAGQLAEAQTNLTEVETFVTEECG